MRRRPCRTGYPLPGSRVRALLVVALLGGAACASVPKEVVELSYTVGEDLTRLRVSYTSLITTYFQGLRNQRLTFLEERWRPVFLRRFLERSDLVAIVSDPENTNDLPDILNIWVEIAMDTIEARRAQLLDPIDRDEAALLQTVHQSFSNLAWANATITSHLNSIREVREVQDQALAGLGLRELRDQIDAALVSISARADSALDQFKRVEGIVDAIPQLPRRNDN